jgi:hypothetical protein
VPFCLESPIAEVACRSDYSCLCISMESPFSGSTVLGSKEGSLSLH